MMPRYLQVIAVVAACLLGLSGCAELGVESRSPVGLLAPGEVAATQAPAPGANASATGSAPTSPGAGAMAATVPPAVLAPPAMTATSLAARPAEGSGLPAQSATVADATAQPAALPPVAALPPPAPMAAPPAGDLARESTRNPQPTALLVGQPTTAAPSRPATVAPPRNAAPMPTTITQSLMPSVEPAAPRSLTSEPVRPNLPALVPPAQTSQAAADRPIAPDPIVLIDQAPSPLQAPVQPTTKSAGETLNVLMPTEPVRSQPTAPVQAAIPSASPVALPERSAPIAALPTPSPLAATPATPAQPPSRTVARVGDEVVNLRDLTAAVKARVAEMPASEKLTRRKIIAQAREVLKGMIIRSLVIQEAREQLGAESVDRTILALEQQWNAAELPELIRRERALGTEDLRVKLVRKDTTPEAVRDEYVIRSLSSQLIQRNGFSGSFEDYLEALRKKRPVTSVMSSSELAKAGEAEARGETLDR